MGIIKKIADIASNRTTYRVGLLQAKAYRILKQHTARALSPHEISTVEWALLGLLKDNPKGLRTSAAADELGVEVPFVTALIQRLAQKGFILERRDPNDGRAKNLTLSKAGERFMDQTESLLRAEIRPLLSGASLGEISGYLAVLAKIAENAERLSKQK